MDWLHSRTARRALLGSAARIGVLWAAGAGRLSAARLVSTTSLGTSTASSLRVNPYLEGNYAPLDDEITRYDLAVEGWIPSALTGHYLRNGPNPQPLPSGP